MSLIPSTMAAISPAGSKSFSFFLLACLLMATAESSGLEFHVGGSRGWIVPAGDETETYNQWAMRNRFHVGDSVYFKYQNDSVLVVDREAYGQCNTTEPLLAFSDGSTTITFHRYGFFYFISGVPGHCEAGQRLIIRVMVHPEAGAPSLAPAPGVQPGGGRGEQSNPGQPSGPSGPNASGASSTRTGIFVFVAGVGSLLLVMSFAY